MTKTRTPIRQGKQSAVQQRNRMLIFGGVAVAVILVAVVFLAQSNQPAVNLNDVPDGSIEFAYQGQQHIEVGAPHVPYNSNPPTSGPHYANPVPAGFYPQQLPDENLVHNLEHGHIWLSYRDQLDQDAIDLLSSIQRNNPQWVVVTYRPEDNNRIAAAAWQRLLVLNDLDEAQLRAFVQRYHDHAPESIPG